MITFILPGYSPSNKKWAEDVAKSLRVSGEVRPIMWDHWTDPKAVFRPEEKVQMMMGIMAGGQANIVAKSIGTLVTVQLISQVPNQLNKVVLCGIPSGVLEKYKGSYTKALTTLPSNKITIFQNQADPLGAFEKIQTEIANINPKITVKSMPGASHDYPYFEEIQKLISG